MICVITVSNKSLLVLLANLINLPVSGYIAQSDVACKIVSSTLVIFCGDNSLIVDECVSEIFFVMITRDNIYSNSRVGCANCEICVHKLKC